MISPAGRSVARSPATPPLAEQAELLDERRRRDGGACHFGAGRQPG